MPRSNDTLIRVAGISLPMLLIAVAAHSALKPPKNAPTVSPALPSAEELDALTQYLTPAVSKGIPVIATATGTRGDQPDPFISLEYVAAAPSSVDTAKGVQPVVRPVVRDRYVVSAILISNDRRIAVINESLVTVGSMLPGGFRVTAIESNHVQIVAPSGASRMLTVRESTAP